MLDDDDYDFDDFGDMSDDEIVEAYPTPWESIYFTLLDYLSDELASEAAAMVVDDLSLVMETLPRPNGSTCTTIATSGDSLDPLEWMPSVRPTEAWY